MSSTVLESCDFGQTYSPPQLLFDKPNFNQFFKVEINIFFLTDPTKHVPKGPTTKGRISWCSDWTPTGGGPHLFYPAYKLIPWAMYLTVKSFSFETVSEKYKTNVIWRVQSIESTKLCLPVPRAWNQREMCRIVQDPVKDPVGNLHTHILCGNVAAFCPLDWVSVHLWSTFIAFYEISGAYYFYLIWPLLN